MEEVLDLLMSFVDFQAFKDLMLAHKLDLGPQHMQVSKHTHGTAAFLMFSQLRLLSALHLAPISGMGSHVSPRAAATASSMTC